MKAITVAVSKKQARAQLLSEAWIGDAVLALHAREKILREDGKLDGPKAERMTSNQFLAVIAEPSEVEAQVGRVYQSDGLQAAFHHIEQRLTPIFERQEQKRTRKSKA